MEGLSLTHKRCTKCGEHKPTTEFHKKQDARDKLRSHCKSCSSRVTRQWIINNPHKKIFNAKKSRAKQAGIEFSLVFEDINWPLVCPVLGIELDYNRYRGIGSGGIPNSPSFDRIDPSKGYAKGNVIIVSQLANQIKSDATIDQLKKVAAFYEQLIPKDTLDQLKKVADFYEQLIPQVGEPNVE